MSMRKISPGEVLRLTHELGLSVRQAVRAEAGVGKTAVSGVREPRQGGRDHVADPARDQRR